MTIANRLRLSLALVAALLAAVMLLQVASMRRAGQGTRALAGLAAAPDTASAVPSDRPVDGPPPSDPYCDECR